MLPVFRGKYKLSKAIIRSSILERRNVEVKGKWDCIFILPNLKENIGFEYFVNGVYEERSILEIESFLPKDALVLDIGANIGTISVPLAKRNPGIKCYCIEASPFVFDFLSQNIAINNLDNAFAFNLAVHEEDELLLPFITPNDKFGKGSYGKSFAGKSNDVTTITVDSFISKFIGKIPDLIKVDVEGFELLAFRGAKDILSKSEAPVIYFEFVDWAESNNAGFKPGMAQQFLIDNGYTLFIEAEGKFIEIKDPIETGSYNVIALKNGNLAKFSSSGKLIT